MNTKEVLTRLAAENITPQQFSGELFASLSHFRPAARHDELPWLGEVRLAARHTDGDADLTITYFLPEHNVYFQTFGICHDEPKLADFGGDEDEFEEARVEWNEAHPNADFAWEWMSHYSPVQPQQKTVTNYVYAPELLAS